jgi:hypothetical protein
MPSGDTLYSHLPLPLPLPLPSPSPLPVLRRHPRAKRRTPALALVSASRAKVAFSPLSPQQTSNDSAGLQPCRSPTPTNPRASAAEANLRQTIKTPSPPPTAHLPSFAPSAFFLGVFCVRLCRCPFFAVILERSEGPPHWPWHPPLELRSPSPLSPRQPSNDSAGLQPCRSPTPTNPRASAAEANLRQTIKTRRHLPQRTCLLCTPLRS